MSDDVAIRSRSGRLPRAMAWGLMAVYCLALFLCSTSPGPSLTRGEETQRVARIANPVYDHGFAAKFEGHDVWGEVRYPLVTNSLGFKDGSARGCAAEIRLASHPPDRRSLRRGNRHAFRGFLRGRLQRGEGRADKIEFLNAGVASYSPSISTTARSGICSKADSSSTRSSCSPTHPMSPTRRPPTSASTRIRSIAPTARHRKDRGSRKRASRNPSS